MTRLRFDPWTADYSGAYLADPGAEAEHPVDIDIEMPGAQWQAVGATEPVRFDHLIFVDGSRRMDARVQVEAGDGTFHAHGGLGTTAVGAVAVRSGQRAVFLPDLRADRWCFVGSGERHEAVILEASGGHLGDLRYNPVSITETDPEAILQALQTQMRIQEALLATRLLQAHADALLVLDGPLPVIGVADRMIGYVKTTSIQRLKPAQLETASRLQAGERTPIYVAGAGDRRNYEWILRLRDPAPWFYSLAGTVRLQVAVPPGEKGLSDFVQQVADWSCTELPRFSSLAHQDPRAPQQLLPVRALEAELKRHMGDGLLLRRRIVRDYFAEQN